jgi:hypothetical protein
MKESTFTLLLAVVLAVVAYFDDDPGSIVGYIMAFGFLPTSSICSAIEKNGKEK